MIKVNNINGVPVSTPTDYVACHSDGAFFYFFENKEEWDNFFASRVVVWSKEAYAEVINAAHSDWYRSIYTRKPDLDYSSIGEIGLYLNHPDFGAQAQALQQLWWDSVEILYAHLESVTEATALSTEDFLATLPPYTYG